MNHSPAEMPVSHVFQSTVRPGGGFFGGQIAQD
jgi:hypothetical protein